MKNICLFLLTISFPFIGFAQKTALLQWQKAYGGGQTELAYSVEKTFDGGYIVAGASASNNGDVSGHHGTKDYADCWVLKTDSAGNIQWQKSIGGFGDDYAKCIRPTRDSGYIVVGYSGYGNVNSGDVTGNHGGYDYLVVKLDSMGNIQWQKSLGGSDDDLAQSVQQTADNGYIIAGSALSTDGDVTGHQPGTPNQDYWVVKLDSAGNIVWQQCLGGTDSDNAFDVQVDNNGYVVAGSTNSGNGDVTGLHGSFDEWVVKLDTSGNVVWQKTLGGSGLDAATSVKTITGGGYIVAGRTNSADGDITQPQPNPAANDVWIVKLDSAANIIWQKKYGGLNEDNANAVQLAGDSAYIIAGYSNSVNGDVTSNHGGTDYWVLKIDTAANIIWQKSLGGTENDVANAITVTADNGCLVAGMTTSNNGDVTGKHGGAGNGDFWVVKLSADSAYVLTLQIINLDGEFKNNATVLHWKTTFENNTGYFNIQRSTDAVAFTNVGKVSAMGNTNSIHSYAFTDDLSKMQNTPPVLYYRLQEVDKDNKLTYSKITGIHTTPGKSEFTISPNPATSNITLHFSNSVTGNLNISIVDMHGRVEQRLTRPAAAEININTSALTAGAYIVLTQVNGKTIQQRFIKQ